MGIKYNNKGTIHVMLSLYSIHCLLLKLIIDFMVIKF